MSQEEISPRYLNAPEAARYMRVSVSWLRKATCGGRLPHAKVGVRVVYDREDLDEFLQARKVDTAWERFDARDVARRGGSRSGAGT